MEKENDTETIRGIDNAGLSVDEDALRIGARKFEMFWLLPDRYSGDSETLRLRLNGKFSGWKLKEGLVQSLGLVVGDTVNITCTVQFGPGVISDSNDVDLFASGEVAEWLINTSIDAGGPDGCIIDGVVRFVYDEAPVGGIEGRDVKKVSLVLEEGLGFVGINKSSVIDSFDFAEIYRKAISSSVEE